MGRTLYLSETEKFKAIADGPSIWINWENKAGQRVPLRLISRCLIIGNIQIESDLISVLAANNIPIIFTNAFGYELAIVLPYNHRLPKRWREQRIFLKNKRNRERYISWAKLKRMILQLRLLKKLFPQKNERFCHDIGEGNYQHLLSFLKPREEDKWKTVKDFIENLFRALIIENMNKAGLDLNLGIIHRYCNFGLVLDFAYILESLIDEQSIQFFLRGKNHKCLEKIEKREKKWKLTKEGLKEVIHRFENKKEESENIIQVTLDEFFELMRELHS